MRVQWLEGGVATTLAPPMPVDLPLLHAVPLSTWTALFRAHGIKRAPTSLEEVRAATRAPGAPLATALRTLRTLSRDDARGALLHGARVLHVDTARWPATTSTAVLAATLLARAPKEPAVADVLRAAELHLCRRAPIALTRRYVATTARLPLTTRAALAKLASIIEHANVQRQAKGAVDVALAAHDARGLALDVVRPEPAVSELLRSAGRALTSASRTPIHVDRLRVERDADGTTTLWIATGAPDLLGAYRAAVGEALFLDPTLFAAARPISLCAVQRNGKAALDRARAVHPRLRDARVVSLLWDPGREETLTIDGRDVLAAVEREELPSHGRVLAARVRLDFDDGPVDLTLRVPNVVHWEPSPHDDAVRAFALALALDALPHDNLVTLAPHDHALWIWRAALGDDVADRLFARKLLVASTHRALGHPELPGAGRMMLAFALGRSGKYYVVPEEGFDVEPWLAGKDDLATYRLDVETLAAEVQRELGADGRAPETIERGTLVDLGGVQVGTSLVRLYLVVAARAIDGLAERLRARSEGAQPVLVVPRGMKLGTGCAEVEMDDLAGPYAPVLAGVARAIGVTAALDAWVRAPKGTRLAVDKKSGRAWLDGVELVALAESSRALVRVLVAAGGKPVTGGACDRKLSGAREGTGAAKKAKLRFVAGVKKSFALVGKEAPRDLERVIEGTRLGYRVTVSAWIG